MVHTSNIESQQARNLGFVFDHLADPQMDNDTRVINKYSNVVWWAER